MDITGTNVDADVDEVSTGVTIFFANDTEDTDGAFVPRFGPKWCTYASFVTSVSPNRSRIVYRITRVRDNVLTIIPYFADWSREESLRMRTVRTDV